MAQATVSTEPRDAETEPNVLAYSVPSAAIFLGVGPLRLWEMIRRNEIPSFTVDGRRFISRRVLDDYLAEREAAGV